VDKLSQPSFAKISADLGITLNFNKQGGVSLTWKVLGGPCKAWDYAKAFAEARSDLD
jgi:hypothetical protein